MSRKRHRIILQRQSQTQSATGQKVDSWTTIVEVWGNIRPVRGVDFQAASGPQSEITHEIYIWFGPVLVPGDRVLFGSRIFSIVNPINIGEKNKEVRLLCTEVWS